MAVSIKSKKQPCFGFLIASARRLEITPLWTLFFENIFQLHRIWQENLIRMTVCLLSRGLGWQCYKGAIFHVAVSIKSNIRNKLALVFWLLKDWKYLCGQHCSLKLFGIFQLHTTWQENPIWYSRMTVQCAVQRIGMRFSRRQSFMWLSL